MKDLTNVFLVDDDDIFVYLTKKIFASTELKTDIKVFHDGLAAIDFLKANAGKPEMFPDIIFLDLNMPVMDGWEFLDEFKDIYPSLGKNIMLYIVSSSISPHDLERAKSISVVTDFCIKPLAADKVIELIEAL
ncbi:MAG: response regulator [Bacteroidetes bacterium]|nr:response regulator [Bacteroidota bacterium]